jgi:hypothetical protein
MSDAPPYSLNRIAEIFENGLQTLPVDSRELCGWGQFLDAPKRLNQVGMYGTCAGLIVISLAGRSRSPTVLKAKEALLEWWADRDNPSLYSHEKLVQTPRLAIFNLAARLSADQAPNEFTGDIENHFAKRQLPSLMWGNYWLSVHDHDQTPRILPTALSILSFTLSRDPNQALPPFVLGAAEALENQLARERAIPECHEIAGLAAVVTARGDNANRATVKRLKRLAISVTSTWNEQAVYFYDLVHLVPNEEIATEKYARDFLIVSQEVFFVIAGLCEYAPNSARLRAEASRRRLWDQVAENNYEYRPDIGERLGCMNQAWAAIVLNLPERGISRHKIGSMLWYRLFRHRKDNWFTNTLFPVSGIISVTALATVAESGGTAFKVIAALAVLIVGKVYRDVEIDKAIGRFIGRH